jgi:hypothetical protein
MHAIVDPAADVLWGSVGTIITAEGTEEIYPRSEEEWLVVEYACITLMESGNLLMIGERAVDQGDWMLMSQAMVDAGKTALDAARSRDPERIFAIGGDVYASCTACHEQYWVEEEEHEMPAGPATASTSASPAP